MRVKSGEKGSITLIVFGIVTFILIILATTFTTLINKHKSQAIELQDLKDIYGMEGEDKIKSVYEEVAFEKGLLNGNGTEEDPYQIWTIEDLVKFSNRTNAGEKFTGKYVELMANLDFNENASYENPARTDYGDINGNNVVEPLKTELTTGTGFPCIAKTAENAFSGDFNGGNHRISNIYIKNITSTAAVGLFARIKNSTISDLQISGSVSSTTHANIGGIVGLAYATESETSIYRCINETNISSSSTSYSLGGICGDMSNSGILNLTDCKNYGKVSGGNNDGGLLGFSNGNIIITNCSNEGEVTNTKGENAGGLIGRDDASGNSIKITNSYNTGEVSGKKCVGGFVGYVKGALEVNDSYNEGDVTGIITNVTEVTCIGGIVGRSYNKSSIANYYTKITNCYNTGNITSNATSSTTNIGIAGLAGRPDYGAEIYNCYNTGKITNGTRAGGIIGEGFGSSSKNASIKIINSYNEGEIDATALNSSNVDDYTYYGSAGGIARGVCNGTIYLLNCYNKGKILTFQRASGLIVGGSTSNYYVINSYNQGNVESQNAIAVGIMSPDTSTNTSGTIVNSYNSGVISKGSDAWGIGNNINTIRNAYWLENTVLGCDVTNINAIQMTEAEMKNANFVTTLNNNKNSINLSDYSLGDYSLLSWKAVANSYPEFNN
ncbi:MAG: hypothetical protein IKG56_02215 [Clostridia bacterium]|nr:hypothetical protein [Clostridia bacterium]